MEPSEFTNTGNFIAVTAVIWVVYDVYAYVTDKPTISGVITRFSWYSPSMPFIAGFLCGHWFW